MTSLSLTARLEDITSRDMVSECLASEGSERVKEPSLPAYCGIGRVDCKYQGRFLTIAASPKNLQVVECKYEVV